MMTKSIHYLMNEIYHSESVKTEKNEFVGEQMEKLCFLKKPGKKEKFEKKFEVFTDPITRFSGLFLFTLECTNCLGFKNLFHLNSSLKIICNQ